MPLFLSDEEFERCSQDAAVVAEKADAFIRRLYTQLETVKAEADAASITAEQTCSLLEQKYVSLSSEHSALQSKFSELSASLEERSAQLSQLETDKHQIQLKSIGKDGEIERLSMEASELHKSKRELMELLERKDLEIAERNSTIKSYLDKIVNLTDAATQREARLSDSESELARARASCARLSQEKELVEKHNSWLNDELKEKVDSLIELRRKYSELEAEFSLKLSDAERNFKESSASLRWHKERVKELESKLESLEQELLSSKDAAAATEERYCAEISTVTKLVDLYKESSEEWSRKAGELEGVIKALETHLNQVESDYKEKLEKEQTASEDFKKETIFLKEKLEACEGELERTRKENESKALSLTFTTDLGMISAGVGNVAEDDRMLVPSYPVGVSGTALAASLLRDGWSLAKMYAKYQEAIDALQHEQLGRKQTQAILERVLYEIEEKSGVILDERAEHERLVEAYSLLNEKLQHSFSEQASLERTIQECKADLRRRERDYAILQKENTDLQKQVTVLLKECRDIQLRCASDSYEYEEGRISDVVISRNGVSEPESIITDQHLTFKDINGLVEQNAQLRSLVRSLSDEIESKQKELQENYEKELQIRTNEAASQVNAVLARAEEQGRMIESLHTSVAMYRKLYEEEHKLRSSFSQSQEVATDDGRKDIMLLLDDSHEASRKAQQQAVERVRTLEEDIAKLRSEIISVRSERDKFLLEAQFAQEKLDRFVKEYEHQREEHNGVIARNVEFSQLIVDYQRKLRESSESRNAAEELSRKLTMEVSVLRNEKEVLVNAEKRATDEVRSLSERVHRLQASLDTIQSAEEVREEAKILERQKQEEYIKRIEREWAEAKKELQEEREIIRNLRGQREDTMKDALKQVEELANASRAVAAAEARAAIAEARCVDLERQKFSENKVVEKDGEIGPSSSADKAVLHSHTAKEDNESLREELQLAKHHMLQYKSIAEVNESAMKKIESVHENYKVDMDKIKKSLEDELQSLRARVEELEIECSQKTREVASVNAEKEEALAAALSEVTTLREDVSVKLTKIAALEIQIDALNGELEKEHQKWRNAQDNYERQVILQSETIQELTRTSQALATLQEEASELRKLVDTLKRENSDLKAKWVEEKSALEVSKCEAERRYNEINELNKVLHSQLEALHIKLAENDRRSVGLPSGSTERSSVDDDGMHNVVNYLRRSKEIAETEISLLKQEKLRLQSQLESALKAAELAQASLHAERSNARSLLFTEEDFKSLQLQVREINLLRESNAQLREENRHNFEECQKLREAAQKIKVDAENLEKSLQDKQNDVEACKKELDMLKVEREQNKKKIDELQETYKNFDVEEYHQTREAVQQMQGNLIEKDAQLEEIRKIVSEKQDMISRLEQDLGRSSTELTERESRINKLLQAEASLKSDIEKQKRLTAQFKKRLEILAKEKENLTKEKENLSKEKENLSKEKENLTKEKENLSKEKDDVSKEKQALVKQLEDAKQGKRSSADAASEQNLKDTRIQMLEKMFERTREELKTEKAKQKTMTESYENVSEQRSKLLDELEKHKQAVKAATDEIEKLKNNRGSESQGASLVRLPSGMGSEDHPGSNLGSVESLERAGQPASDEHGVHVSADTSSMETSSSVTTMGQAVPPLAPSISDVAGGPSIPAVKTAEEKEKSSTVPKTNVETRKAGRKLVRPRIIKPEEPQSDLEMSEMDGGSNNGGKQSSAASVDNQGNTMATASRKRPSISLTSESQEDLLALEETSSDTAVPLPKKAKGIDTPQEDEGQTVANEEALGLSSVLDESMVDVGNEVSNEEPVDVNKDIVETPGDLLEESKPHAKDQGELQDDGVDAANESSDRRNEVISDDQLKVEAVQEIQQPGTESGSDLEEGELLGDGGDEEGGDNVPSSMESPEIEPLSERAEAPQDGNDEESLTSSAIDVKDVDPLQGEDDGKNDEAVKAEDVDSSKRSNDIREQAPAEGDQVNETTTIPDRTGTSGAGESSGSRRMSTSADTEGRQVSPIGRSDTEGRQVSPISRSDTEGRQVSPAGRTIHLNRTINLSERARERANIRQAGMVSSSSTRARGRARGRGGRVARGGRGQSGGE